MLHALLIFAIAQAAPESLELDSLNFTAPVNVKAFTVKGRAETAQIAAEREGAKLKSLLVSIPASALTTGIGMRDSHMRERIFQTPEGALPDLEFRSTAAAACAAGAECEIPGMLKIQGKEQALVLKTRLEGKIAIGKAEIFLSKYGIALPEHLGVKVQEPIQIEFKTK